MRALRKMASLDNARLLFEVADSFENVDKGSLSERIRAIAFENAAAAAKPHNCLAMLVWLGFLFFLASLRPNPRVSTQSLGLEHRGDAAAEELMSTCLEIVRQDSKEALGLAKKSAGPIAWDSVSEEAMLLVLGQEVLSLRGEEQVWDAVVLFARSGCSRCSFSREKGGC